MRRHDESNNPRLGIKVRGVKLEELNDVLRENLRPSAAY
jgi:hypothetical protein